MKIKIIEATAPIRTFTIEKVKREIGVNGEEPAGEYHRHTLEESDRIKRNTVQRQALKLEKEIKRVQVSSSPLNRLCISSTWRHTDTLKYNYAWCILGKDS